MGPVKLWEAVLDGDWQRNCAVLWQKQMLDQLIAIDPGTTHSGVVVLQDGVPKGGVKCANEKALHLLQTSDAAVVIESVASYGKPVGVETFETVLWYGRFVQAHLERSERPVMLLRRPDVKQQLCYTTKGVTDAVLRQRMLDKFGGRSAIGTKGQPGVLYGFKRDIWQALAVGVAALEMVEQVAARQRRQFREVNVQGDE